MYTTLNAQAQLFVANLERTQQNMDDATAELSSGLQLTQASDSPDQVDLLLQLRANLQQNTQIQSNLTLAQTDASTADSTLNAAASLMNTAIQLATEGANATQTAESRASIAVQAQSLLTQMVAYSQTQVAGRYIFSGDDDQSPSYQLDLTAPTGVDQLSNAAATKQIQNPAGGSFSAYLTAQQIFDDQNADGTPATDNVFAALFNLYTALTSPTNAQADVANTVDQLQAAADHLGDMDAFYGNVENQITQANTFASSYATQLQSQIGNIQDANIPAVATNLTQDQVQLEAAMQSQAELPTKSLFDYLG
jgi:flagellin-like hook-associated protein FlgL